MKRFILKWGRRLFLLLLGLAAVLIIYITATPQGRAGFQTALFVLQVLDLGFKPQAWFTKEPVRREVSYPQAAGFGLADIYRIPDGEERAAVLIFLGANAAGRDDKDVVNLGNALARSGFVTMFHWSPTMALNHNIDPAEIENLVWAFQYLSSRDFVDQDRVGMGGFCVGASFALVAASDPRIRDDVVFLNAFGPYFDARYLLLQLASRSRLYQGESEPWEPDRLTMRVFANELIESLQDPQARQTLSRMFLQGQDVPDAELNGLPPEAQRILQLLEGTSLKEAEDIYQLLPAEFRADMESISPSAHVDGLKARLMIMHDRYDRLVPAAESRRLASALEERGNFRYTEVLAFEHVRPAAGGGIGQLIKEAAKLYRHMYGIIREGV